MVSATLRRTESHAPEPAIRTVELDACLGPDCRTIVIVGTGWAGFCDSCTDLLIVHVTHAEAPHDDCPGCTDGLGW